MLSLLFLALFPLTLAYLYVVCAPHVPTQSLQRKYAIITGGSTGIGLETAKQLVQQGCNVCIIARNKQKLEAAVEQINAVNMHNVAVTSQSADITSEQGIKTAIDAAVKAFHPDTSNPSLDILVCNAGSVYPLMFDDTDTSVFQRLMDMNYMGTVHTIKAGMPYLKQSAKQNLRSGSRLMIVSSLSGLIGVAGYSSYTPSKFALRGLAECLHMELTPQNIYVSLCNPPDTDTPTYEEEQKIKPQECKEISAGSGVFQPSAVAKSIVQTLQSYRFMTTVGFDGWVLTRLNYGSGPADSPLRTFADLVLLGPLRVIFLGFRYQFNQICIKCHKQRLSGKPIEGKAYGSTVAAAKSVKT